MNKLRLLPCLGAFCIAAAVAQEAPNSAQEAAARERRVVEMATAVNPLPPRTSPWIEEMTYMEVRDLIKSGYTTAIIATGGVEQNGPYIVTGKHNVALRAFCPAIAARLGKALCAPIVAFVPEGNIDPPTGHMRFPGSFSVRAETYEALLEDIAGSLRQHGFRHIVMIGDSGGNQRGLAAAAARLQQRWQADGVSVHHIPEFYDGWNDMIRYGKETLGLVETRNDGLHDDIFVTSVLMAIDPQAVRHAERVASRTASINGVDLSDARRYAGIGQKLIDFRVALTVDAIRRRLPPDAPAPR